MMFRTTFLPVLLSSPVCSAELSYDHAKVQ